jgi:hypothetical protein
VPQLNVRLSELERDRWRSVAHARGMNVTGMLKLAVEEFAHSRNSNALADAVAERVLRDLEPLLQRPLEPAPSLPFAGPRQFDVTCDQADFHVEGTVCRECGGETNLRRAPHRSAGPA